ncbi:MAG: hypothetical protein HY902_11260 [Deltaproteobacteria bacterium]|nr:hypothetical protein [Deltaproteobacteria bacterium]
MLGKTVPPRLLLLLLAGLTAALRLRNLPDLHWGDRWFAVSGDSWYHVRRMLWQAAGHGPLHRDAWVHVPAGNVVVWPDGFDAVGATLAAGLGGDRNAVLWAGYALVTGCAAATTVLAAHLAGQLAPAAQRVRAMVVAGLLVACHPGLHNYTQVGKIDHHAAEPLVTFAALAALLGLQRAAGVGRVALAVVLTAAPLELWPSSAMTVALLAGLAGLALLASEPEQRSGFSRRLALVFAAAALLALPRGLASPLGHGGAVVAEGLSLLQPGLLGVAAATLLAMGAGAQTGPLGRWRAVAQGLTGVAVALAIWEPGRRALFGGGDFVAGRGYVALIAESTSAAENGWSGTLKLLSWPALATPLLLLWALRQREQRARHVTWAAALAIGVLLGVLQQRFATLSAVPLAVLAGAGLVQLAESRGRPGIAYAIAALALLPGLADVASRPLPLARRAPVWRALDWLAAHEPAAGEADNPQSTPSYAVLAGWGFGHDLLAWGGQANVCSPLIAPGQTAGLDACADLILGGGDRPELVAQHRIRYWIATQVPGASLRAYGIARGQPADRYVVDLADGSRKLTGEAECSNAQVLFYANGSASPDGRCTARPEWRLLHATAGERAKVFERVQGAVLAGRGCAAGQTPRAEVLLQVGDQGYRWLAFGAARADGHWSLRVPWSTDQRHGDVRVAELRAGCGVLTKVNVPEAAVQRGDTIEVADTSGRFGEPPALPHAATGASR